MTPAQEKSFCYQGCWLSTTNTGGWGWIGRWSPLWWSCRCLSEVGLASQRLALPFGPPQSTNGILILLARRLGVCSRFLSRKKMVSRRRTPQQNYDKSNYTEVGVINRHGLFGHQNGIEINFVVCFASKLWLNPFKLRHPPLKKKARQSVFFLYTICPIYIF